MWVTSKLCNVRAYSHYAFGLPQLNSKVMEFVNMVPRECCSCYIDYSCFLFLSEMQKASTFLDLRNAFSVI